MSNILFIDDEQDILDLARIFFEQHGMQLDVALNAEEALKKFSHSHYKVVISDSRMPGLKGEDLFMKLREEMAFKGTLILISGHRERTVPTDKYEVLPKPLSFELLANKIQKILGASA